MKTIRVLRVLVLVGLFMVVMIPALLASGSAKQPGNTQVEYKTLNPHDFSAFVRKWDANRYPVLYALIYSPVQWKAIFHPAPVMGSKHPFSPDKKLYDNKQILIVAKSRVKPESLLKVKGITEEKDKLALYYSFVPGDLRANYTINWYLPVVIPKHDYKTIEFIENGKKIGTLNIAKGQWCFPQVLKLNKVDADDGKIAAPDPRR